MKYLRPFNESLSFKDELLDFCESNLAYLLDEGNKVKVSYRHSHKINYSKVPAGADLYLVEIILEQPKPWDEIKDYMIPFLTRLINKYEINSANAIAKSGLITDDSLDIELYLTTNTNISFLPIYYKIKDLIRQENFRSSKLIEQMNFVVTGYKQPKKSFISKIKSFFK